MKNFIRRIKEFVNKNKKEQWFKNTVIIVVLLIAAIAADRWRKWEDSKELPQTEIVEEAPEKEEHDVLRKYGTITRLILLLLEDCPLPFLSSNAGMRQGLKKVSV